MQAYADSVARSVFSGDFKRWCTDPPPGEEHCISAGKIALDESETVRGNAGLFGLRMLPVPAEVAPSERIYMGAHVRLGGGAGMSAPRMHFYDDAKGSGKIYIGYLGPHLKTARTN
jgi:hypothetical protein